MRIFIFITTLFIFLVGVWFFVQYATPAVTDGAGDKCKAPPAFLAQKGLVSPVAIDTTQQGFVGVRLREAKRGGKILQLPSWEKAGALGAYATDRKGNIYLVQSPHVHLGNKEQLAQNTVWMIDTRDGEMRKMFDLPTPPVNLRNPYGTVGLAYDCDTESLYVSSVAGSDPDTVRGKIFHIDLKRQKISDIYEEVDALGLAIWTRNGQKRLYYGNARQSEVRSVILDAKGGFAGGDRREFGLIEVSGNFDKAQRLRFRSDGTLEVKGIEFEFSLITAGKAIRNFYLFGFEERDWRLLDLRQE